MAMRSAPGLGLMALLLVAGAAADEITEQIALAQQYYKDGDLTAAATELAFAASAVRVKLSARLAATLPPAPMGWSAAEPEIDAAAAAFGGSATVRRAYAGPDGASLEAQLVLDGPMVQAFAAMAGSAALLAGQRGVERVRLGRDHALLDWDAPAGSGSLALPLAGRVLVRIEGRKLADKAVLVELLRRWDLDAVRAGAGL
jgi:hypothetical protein